MFAIICDGCVFVCLSAWDWLAWIQPVVFGCDWFHILFAIAMSARFTKDLAQYTVGIDRSHKPTIFWSGVFIWHRIRLNLPHYSSLDSIPSTYLFTCVSNLIDILHKNIQKQKSIVNKHPADGNEPRTRDTCIAYKFVSMFVVNIQSAA